MVACGLCHHQKTQLSYLKNNYQYYFCPKCINLFIHPFPNNKDLSIYYKKFANSAPQQEKLIRSRSKLIINQLKKLNPFGINLIDVGSGYGFFLDEAKKKNLSILGIEPSTKSYKFAKSILRLSVRNVNIETFFRNPVKKYDFVIFSHVIEHIKNPKKVIFQLSKLLKPNGILYIETPNVNSHLFYVEKENYTFLLPPEHLWIFSLKSISYIIPSNLSVIKVNTYSQPQHLMGIIKNIFKKSLSKNTFPTTNTFRQTKKSIKIVKKLKYLLLDKILAPIFTPLLNLNNRGSILQIYLQKNEKH